MKKISLNNFQSEKGKYTVCLGNGTATTFTNKEKAERFLSETGSFLTQQLFNINKATTLVNIFYRDCNWLYLDNKGKANYAETERYCEASLLSVKNNLSLAVNRCTWTNGNYFTFIHLQNAVKDLKTVLKELAPLCKKRSATDSLYTIDFLFKTVLTNIENDLNNYGFLGARLFKVPVHELDYQTEYKPDFKTTKLKAI